MTFYGTFPSLAPQLGQLRVCSVMISMTAECSTSVDFSTRFTVHSTAVLELAVVLVVKDSSSCVSWVQLVGTSCPDISSKL